ncbi:MAG: hypothetical protein H3Z53_11610, partial [archaeon]|nr:hypothetical protein [archaeon]
FKIDKSFSTKSEITKRTVEISDAFGIGVDESKEFVIFKDFTIDTNPKDIIYITGESGSGKSVLLKELANKISGIDEFGGVIRDSDLEIDKDEILVEGVGKDTKDALNILSMAGLNEAFLFLRRYKELSDGQRYRYKIAKMLDSKKNTWVMDEFCSTLDRVTAKVVAYCVQKVARRQGKTVLVATTHDDLFYDLNPTIHIEKRFGHDVHLNYYKYEPRECSILKEIIMEEGSLKDYKKLEHLHYRSGLPIFTKKIYVAKIKDETIGIIVYGSPYFHLKARNYALPQYSGKMTKDKMAIINRDFLRIWRVIVLPKYRSIGLGVKLVKDTLPLVNVPYVETIAIMAKYNPFFEKAGMIRIDAPETDIDRLYKKNLEKLESLGFNLDLLSSKRHNLMVINRLKEDQMEELKRIIHKNFMAKKFRGNALLKSIEQNDKDAMAEALKRHRLNPTYLIYKNPKFKDYPDPLSFKFECIRP